MFLLTVFESTIPTLAAPPDTEITILQPDDSFPVPADKGRTIRELRSSNGSLWVLLGGGSAAELRQVDITGRIKSITPIPTTSMPDHFCLNSSKHLIAVHFMHGVMAVYDSGGNVRDADLPARHSFGCAYVSDELVSINGEGLTPANRPAQPMPKAVPRIPLASPSLILQTAPSNFVVLDQVDAIMSVFDGATNQWVQKRLLAPEIQGVAREPRTEDGAMPSVISIAVDERSGDMLALTSPYRITDGAPVLRFSASGELKARYRCTLSRRQELVTSLNKGGSFFPDQVAVLAGRLVLISRSQRLCYLYTPN